MFSVLSGECTVCGGRNGYHYPWCGHAARVLSGGCPGGRHYFVRDGGRWVCTMCGATR